jgi:ABC-2 type transport system permease protein
MAQILILFIVGKFLFKAHYGNSLPGIFLVALCFTATVAGISLFLGSVFRKEEVLMVFNILAANVMSALGGCWFPQEIMPPGLKAAGMIFPTGWAMDAFHQLIFLGAGISAIRLHLGVLSLYTVLFLFIAVRFFKVR